MSENVIEDFGTGTDGTASPSVKIPITVKHHITPPEEPDDLTAGDSASEGEASDAYFVVNHAETTTQSEASAIDPYRSFNFTVEFDGGGTGEQMNGVSAFVDASDVYGGDADSDGDHDIIFDPDGDLLPPGEPVGAGDGPHQGRHDIGGYVPSTIIAGATDLQAPGTGGDTGSAEEAPARDDEGDTLVHEIGHWLGVAPATGEDTREGSPAPTGIMQSVEPTLEAAPDPQSASPVIPDIIVRDEKSAPPPPSATETASGSPGHFTQMVWADTRDSADAGSRGGNLGGGDIILVDIVGSSANESTDSFDFADLPGDSGAPVPPDEIIIMPGSSCPPGLTDDGGCGDPVPDMPVDEGVPDWGMELA